MVTKQTILALKDHPFKEGIKGILHEHFAPSIANKFQIYLEVELYNPNAKAAQNLRNQLRDARYIAEVHYITPAGLAIYICDVSSWWPKKQCEFQLLKHITDKVRTGEIGKDWTEVELRVSKDVRSGKYETPDEEITKYMAHNAKKERVVN